jgi:hypothetical protein
MTAHTAPVAQSRTPATRMADATGTKPRSKESKSFLVLFSKKNCFLGLCFSVPRVRLNAD